MIVKIDLGVLTFEVGEVSLCELETKLDEPMRAKEREAFKAFFKKHDVLNEGNRIVLLVVKGWIHGALLPARVAL